MNFSHIRSDKRICVLGTLVVATLTVYGSLVPFDLSWSEGLDPRGWLAELRFTPWSHVSPTDLLVNIAVGVPLGFVLMGALRAGGRRSAVGAAVAVLVIGCISTVLGVAVELLQVLSPTRQGSWDDVFAQALGACVGALAWTFAGRAVLQCLRDLASERASCTFAARLLQLYLPIYLLVQLTPFDSGRAAELATKYNGDALLPSAHSVESTFVVWLSLAGNGLLTIPIGCLAVLGWVRKGARCPVGWAVPLGVSIVMTVGIAQQIVWRNTRVSELLTGSLGIMIGAAAAAVLLRSHARVRKPLGDPRRLHGWFLVAAAAWTLVLVGYSWYPFDFELTSEIVRRRLTRISQVPFYFYYWYAAYVVNPLEAVHETVLNFLLAVPLGSLVRLAWPVAVEPGIRRRQNVAAIGVAIIVLLGIELGQMFLPTRFPDVTNVLIGAIGAMAGTMTLTAFACRQWTNTRRYVDREASPPSTVDAMPRLVTLRTARPRIAGMRSPRHRARQRDPLISRRQPTATNSGHSHFRGRL